MSSGDALCLDDFEALARARLAPETFDYYAGGAGDEITLRANRAAWQRRTLRAHVLAGHDARPSLALNLLGCELRLPVLAAPMALQGLAHAEAELATARAVHAAGSVFVHSTLASTPLQDVVRAAPGRVFFQLYMLRSRRLTEALVARAEECGCRALVLTVDAPQPGRRERDLRHGFRVPVAQALRHLLPEHLRPLADELADGGLQRALHAGLRWADLDWLRARCSLPLVLKGILRGDDARRAADAGVAAVVVSNHGGRQLDGAPATADVLGEVVEALAGHAEVLVDGGLRRGVDVVKALALGARAVLLGRPLLWGLASDGQRGVARVLELMRDELELALGLCGVGALQDVKADLLGPTS